MSNFYSAYLEAMEWTECHPDNPELHEASGWSNELLNSSKADCAAFERDNATLLSDAYAYYDYIAEQAGHDFWLTRNGHGAGFWDRGLGNIGDKLTDSAHQFGPAVLYTGDDRLIYIYGG